MNDCCQALMTRRDCWINVACWRNKKSHGMLFKVAAQAEMPKYPLPRENNLFDAPLAP